MIVGDERSQIPSGSIVDQVYDPDLLPRLRSLLASLADLDVAHASNLIVIESRPMDEAREDRLMADLWLSHCRQRAPFVREIEALRARMDAAFR
ncbi:hypothetical protein [Microvirga yunnanensis]|uniref:hypothetical protein n=1 Tax=Microvirga yunnanensis TaxID=2953740 RepID=UPI0021CA200A|nr:hypothetical protein [Microvirga sp. HBU65207]